MARCMPLFINLLCMTMLTVRALENLPRMHMKPVLGYELGNALEASLDVAYDGPCHEHCSTCSNSNDWKDCTSCPEGHYLSLVGNVNSTHYKGFCTLHSAVWPSLRVFTVPEWGTSMLDRTSTLYYTKETNSLTKTYAFVNASILTSCTHDQKQFTNLVVGVSSVKHISCAAPVAGQPASCQTRKTGHVAKLCYLTESTESCHLMSHPCTSPGVSTDVSAVHQSFTTGCCFAPADVPTEHSWMWLGQPNATAAIQNMAVLTLPVE